MPPRSSGPFRIAVDARHLRTSTGTYIDRLLAHLQEIDHTNQYTVLLKAKDEPTWQPGAANFSKALADYPIYSMAEQTGLLRFLNRERFDLVHFCMPQQPVLYRGLHVTTMHDLTLLKARSSSRPWLEYRAKQFVGRFVYRRIVRSSKLVIVPSRFTGNETISVLGADPRKLVLTYEAAELFPDPPKAVAGVPERYVLYVGGQNDYKNVPRLAQAIARLRATDPSLHLVLVGRVDAAATANLRTFQRLGVSHVVHATGPVSAGQLDWLYRHALLYAFPSLMEGFGLPGLEAMLRGVPVASSNATCLPEIYGDAVEYFDPEDPSDIAATIGDVLNSPARRAELVARGHAKAASYSWRRLAEQTHAAYESALRIAPSGR